MGPPTHSPASEYVPPLGSWGEPHSLVTFSTVCKIFVRFAQNLVENWYLVVSHFPRFLIFTRGKYTLENFLSVTSFYFNNNFVLLLRVLSHDASPRRYSMMQWEKIIMEGPDSVFLSSYLALFPPPTPIAATDTMTIVPPHPLSYSYFSL